MRTSLSELHSPANPAGRPFSTRLLPWVLALGCGLLGWPIPLHALDTAKSVFQFNLQSWTRQNGLPVNKINTIAQSSDGYIWLGTPAGLVRFDGISFKVIRADFSGAETTEIRKIVAAKNGGVRLVMNHGGSATYDGQAFAPITDSRWPRGITGKTILETRDGAVWIGSNLGFSRWVAGRPEETIFNDAPARVFAMAEAPSGRVWLGTEERGLFYVENGKVTEVIDPTVKLAAVRALAVDAEGNVWVGSNRGLLCYDQNGNPKEIPPLPNPINALLFDRTGALWIGRNTGVMRYQNGKYSSLGHVDGLASDIVTALFEDVEGSIWVGTQLGLTQLSDLKFPIFSRTEGLSGGPGHFVAASRKGGLWFTSDQGFSYFDGTNARTDSGTNIVSLPQVGLVFEARNGDVYFSDSRKVISVLSGDRRSAQYINDDVPAAFAEDAESIIVGLGVNLFRIHDGKIAPYEYQGGVKPNFGFISYLFVPKDGTLWVGSAQGIFRIKDGQFRQWTTANGLSGSRVNFICEDTDGGIWVGLPTGMTRIKDERLTNITMKDGLPDNRIDAIVADDHGFFWIDSGAGYARIATQSLNDFADGKVSRVSAELFDGLESVKNIDRGNNQRFSGCKTTDGRIWFPNPQGVVMIDPANFVTNRIPPPVQIDEIRVNGVTVAERHNLVLQPNDDRLEILFSALSYISSQKVQVQYQLQGLDAGWIDAGGRRSAVYNHLAPGHYTFRVRARNADGIPSVADAEVGLERLPRFYQTGWFVALSGFAAVTALVGAYRWKIRRIRAQQRQLQDANELLESKVVKRTEELAHERDLLQILLDRLPDTIYFKDLQSRFTRVSRSMAERSQQILLANYRLGHADSGADDLPAHLTDLAHMSAWLIGKTDADVFDAESARMAFEGEQEIIRTGQPVVGRLECSTLPGGQSLWQIVTKMPWYDKDGKVIGTFGTSHDITAIKEAEAKLADTHKQLLVTSRQAGMAEVATGVLHNVGNVLNSVNVSATLVADHVRHSKAGKVAKLAALFDQNKSNLAAFLTEDPRGKTVPAYLGTLAEMLTDEQKSLIAELERLRKDIEHIKEIVAMQQTYATFSGVNETVSVVDMVEDALRVTAGTLARHDVDTLRDYRDRPVVTTDKHKVMQILINLVRNAKYACDESGRTDKLITVRTTSDEFGVKISIIDNGVGIPAENLVRIFNHGFTTRKTGHGFGLHSGALAAKEIGGALNVHSDGPGHGAVFTLELPFKPAAVRASERPPAEISA